MTSPSATSAAPDRASARVPSVVFPAVEMLILLVVLALAWKSWSVWPPVPLADPDTWGYLNPALTWLSGIGLQQTDGRDWLYPALVALFLKTTGSFTGIVAWQKAFSFLAGVFMATTWRCWVSMLPFHRGILFVISALGALPIYVQLVNQQTIFFAMSIRPEAILPLFVYAQLTCVMVYCKYRWQTPRPLPSLAWGAAAIVLAYGCLLLKPSWYLAAATTSVPIVLGLFGNALSLKTRLFTPLLGIAAALLLLWLPGRVLMVKDGASITLLPDALFCVHAQFIDNLLESRLSAMPDSDPNKARLHTFVAVLESELYGASHAHKTYEKLGFNADYLMHSKTLSDAIFEYAGNDRKKFSAFCMGCYKDAVLRDPVGYTQKIFVQFTHFLFPEPKTFFNDQVNLTKAYRDTADSWNSVGAAPLSPDVQKMYATYRDDTTTQTGITKTLEKDPKLRTFRQRFAPFTLPLTVLFLLALLAASVVPPLYKLRLGGWAAFFLYLAPLGNAFGVCIVHTLDIYRYRITYGGYLLYALAAMAVFTCLIVAQLLSLVAARRSSHKAT